MSQQAPPRFTPPALLTDLLAAGLDAGYAEAARRRAERRAGDPDAPDGPDAGRDGGRRVFAVLAVVVALLAGLVVAIGWNAAHRAAPAQATLHAQLVARAEAARSAAAGLEQRAGAAASAVASLQSAALSGDSRGAAVQAGLQQARIAAGDVPVTGPGLTVTVTDPSAPDTTAPGGRAGSTPLAQVRVVTDTDIRDVVNALWAAGAQAVAVDQVRITPTSAIRVAGEDVLVDFRTVSSPYTVRAVGDADGLSVAFARSAVAARLQTLSGARGIGFRLDTATRLTLPASVVPAPRYASALPTPVPSATASPAAPATSGGPAGPTGSSSSAAGPSGSSS